MAVVQGTGPVPCVLPTSDTALLFGPQKQTEPPPNAPGSVRNGISSNHGVCRLQTTPLVPMACTFSALHSGGVVVAVQ